MVLVPAPPVTELARMVRDRVHRAFRGEERERAINGREPCSFTRAAKARVEYLRGHVTPLAHQLREDERSRAGRTHTEPFESLPRTPDLLVVTRHGR